jgi:hypothetical protein
MFAMDAEGNGYELDNIGNLNQVIKYNPEEMDNYLKRWNGQITGYLTVQINSKLFDQAFRYLDITRSGYPYRFSQSNSNAFIRDLVRMSGGNMPSDTSFGCVAGGITDFLKYCK